MRLQVMVLVLVLGSAWAATAEDVVEATAVPAGPAPTIDGTLSDEEWSAASKVELAPQGEAYLVRHGSSLYVGIRAGRRCLPSLFLVDDDRVLVLHSSASLGTGVYERVNGRFESRRTFSWRCRDGRSDDEGRRQFLADEGWLASTDAMGQRGEAEFRIDRQLLGETLVRVAIVALRLGQGPPSPSVWPGTVRDGSTTMNLLMGCCPETLDFELSRWARLDLQDGPADAERFQALLTELEKAAAAEPVTTYVRLLDLIEETAGSGADVSPARRLCLTLERKAQVKPEAAANRRLEEVLAWLAKNEEAVESSTKTRDQAIEKLHEVEQRHAGTRAARKAKERRESLP